MLVSMQSPVKNAIKEGYITEAPQCSVCMEDMD